MVRCNPDNWVSKKYQSYVGCEVHPDFIKFQDFAEWATKQIGYDQTGWNLDKDILIPGNKMYGPDTCCFVPGEINTLLVKPKSADLPTGVAFYKPTNKYVAQISIFGVRQYLGCSSSVDDLLPIYHAAKLNYIKQVANLWKESIDPRVYAALVSWIP